MERQVQITDLLNGIPHIEELRAARDAERKSAWIVGGSVRDLLLQRVPADVDVTAADPEPLAQRFAGFVNGRVVPMDPERGIWRVGISANQYFDFCRFRDSDITGDLLGRDFTMNAIALRLPERGDAGGLYDPLNGLDDINASVIRMVNRHAFQDDPLRILRAFRFHAELDYAIDLATWDTLSQAVDRLPLVAPERILTEWWKLCSGGHAAESIQLMDDAGALTTLFPELRAAKGITQNAYHHLDVWEHTLLAVTYMARFLFHPDEPFGSLAKEFTSVYSDVHRRARLVFLALIHDMGKPASRVVQDDKVHFYGHEIVGADMASAICRRYRMSREDTRIITTVVRQHLRPLHLLNSFKRGDLTPKAMIKFFDDTGDCALDILALAMADKSAGQGAAADPDIQQRLRDLYQTLFTFYHDHYLPAIEHPFLTGTVLTQQINIPTGPRIGHLLHRARNLQITGEFSTQDEALNWAARHRNEV
ncbi:MAG TPA: HD domain-containing protein [Armatimonadota bacterium]|nr:HD domain-containing protein [Armatimonadota bacterium]